MVVAAYHDRGEIDGSSNKLATRHSIVTLAEPMVFVFVVRKIWLKCSNLYRIPRVVDFLPRRRYNCVPVPCECECECELQLRY